MNQYQTSTPRAAAGLGAVIVTSMVLGLAVVAPAKMASDAQGLRAAAASKAVLPAATEVQITPAHIKVIGVRTTDVAQAPAHNARPKL